MYNTKFICTYNYYDPNLPILKPLKDDTDVKDLEDVSDDLYKAEFLQLFGLKTYEDNIIEKALSEISLKIKAYKPFSECILKAANRMMSEDIEVGIYVLYSYHYFYLTHICVSEFLETGEISSEPISLLLKSIG